MWNIIQHSPLFFLKFSQKGIYEIYVTDFIDIWNVCFSKSEFLLCLKNSNINLEMREDDLIRQGTEMLLNPQKLKNVKLQYLREENILDVAMKMSFGYLLKLELKLPKGSSDLFFNEITLPLLKIMQDLKNSQEGLCKILKKKDKEIDNYKSEGAEIPRCYRTVIFDDKEYMNKYNTYKEYFGSSPIPKALLEKTINLPDKIKIKQESINNEIGKRETNTVIKTETTEQPVSGTINMPSVPETINVRREIKTESDTLIATPYKRQRKGKKLNL